MPTPRYSAPMPRPSAGLPSIRPKRWCSPRIVPFDPEKGTGYIRETLRILDGLNLAKDVKEKIFYKNLEKITGKVFVK